MASLSDGAALQNVASVVADAKAAGLSSTTAAAEVFRRVADGSMPYVDHAEVMRAVGEVYAYSVNGIDSTSATEHAGDLDNTPDYSTIDANAQDGAYGAVANTMPEPPMLCLPSWSRVNAENPPKRAPELVEGLLRLGHTGLLVARAKSGKSWAAIALCVAVASGRPWLGFQTRQGRCIFLDPELDARSLAHRFRRVADSTGVDPAIIDQNVVRWSLRGVTVNGAAPNIAHVAHDLAARVESGSLTHGTVSLVVIDSCSALLAGDENASSDVRAFNASALRIAEVTGASVLLIHHEGKTQSGDVDAISRGRGSSAWSDCPDLVLSLVETFPASGEASDYLQEGQRAFTLEAAAIREFGPVAPRRLIWQYPAFSEDADGLTDGWKPRSGQQAGGRASGDTRKAKAELRAARCEAALLAYMYQHDTPDDGIPAAEAATICTEAIGETVTTNGLKSYVEASSLLDVYQRSPKRWHVVPAHLKARPQLTRAKGGGNLWEGPPALP